MAMALLACLLAAAPVVVLSDCETLAGWPRGAELIADAKVGAQAVRLTVPPGAMTGPALTLPADFNPQPSQWLTFWYRVTGRGALGLMIKIVAPMSAGWQATWPLVERAAADGVWRQARLDLGAEFMQWGDQPTPTARWVGFRAQAEPEAELTLDIDQVQLEPVLFRAKLAGTRLAGEQLQTELLLTNTVAEPQSLEVGGQAVDLAANEERRVAVVLPINSAALAALPPLSLRHESVDVRVAGAPETSMTFDVPYTAPLQLPPHPRLALSAAEVPEVQARAAADPVLAARLSALLSDAENRYQQPVELPDRGGQWYHWYACPDDGGNLRATSPTAHECPVCRKVYTGWPYDDVYLSTRHNNYAASVRTLGLAYALSGETRFAERAREILLAYADRYDSYPLHNIHGKAAVGGGKVGPQTLDEATWLISICQGADQIWPTLSAADRTTIGDRLLRPAAEVIRGHRMGIHNIQCWKNSAVGLVGLLLDDAELVADAVRGTAGYENQIAQGINLDGQWYEGAWGYHFYTMNALVPLAEAGARCGLGLYEFEREGRSFRLLFDGPLNLAMPDGVLPNFSDSGFVNVAGSAALYEYALRRYGDPRYAALIGGTKGDSLEALLIGQRPLPAAAQTSAGTRLFPHAGYSVLQAGAGRDATWACLKWGPYGGGHGHPDKLSVILYSRGQVITVDPGTGKYGIALHSGWQQASAAHNTLIVDEVNQAAVDGRTLAFEQGDGWSAALAAAGSIYAGVTYRRAVALIGTDLLLVFDQVQADKPRTLDLAWHLGGAWTTAPTGTAVTMPDKAGYRYLLDMVRVDGALPAVTREPVTTQLTVASAQPGETWAGTGPGATVNERQPAVLHRTVGAEAQVAWALSLTGQPVPVGLERVGDTWRLTAAGATLIVAGNTVRVER